MSAITHLFAGVAVADYDSAIVWYERLFGRPPDVIVKSDEAMWQVSERAWVYVVADASRAGRALLAVFVEDLERQLAALAERGLAAGEIELVAPRTRKAAIADPEGNRIAFVEHRGGGD